ncbi:MAG: LOG family protein [Ahrensia sp.]|nr:LOG family protein [Ahrensia sp.]
MTKLTTPIPRSPLKRSHKDREQMRTVPDTPQTRSQAYKLAFDDMEFLCRHETRPIRLQLELMKPELLMEEAGIVSTTVLFGGARIAEPGTKPWAARNETQAKSLKASSKYYDEARRYAQLSSLASKKTGFSEYVVVTGGGPGVMEAGARGALDVGAPNIGLNIVLPHEQAPNKYVTPEFSFNFHYFAIRKMHFLMRASSVAIFPGGFGTLDEFFETLTLIQTGRMERIPVVLFGKQFWERVINIEALAEEGTIAPDDPDLFTIVDTAEQGWSLVSSYYGLDD